MITFYTASITPEIDLVFTRDNIIINVYADTSEVYDTFEHTLMSMVEATGSKLETIKLGDGAREIIKHILDSIENGKLIYDEHDVIEYILKSR